MQTKKGVKQFCHSILQMAVQKNKAIANLVMGLASQSFAKSVVEISLSPCYHYQYSSISDAINAIFESKAYEREKTATARLEAEKKYVFKEGLFCKAF